MRPQCGVPGSGAAPLAATCSFVASCGAPVQVLALRLLAPRKARQKGRNHKARRQEGSKVILPHGAEVAAFVRLQLAPNADRTEDQEGASGTAGSQRTDSYSTSSRRSSGPGPQLRLGLLQGAYKGPLLRWVPWGRHCGYLRLALETGSVRSYPISKFQVFPGRSSSERSRRQKVGGMGWAVRKHEGTRGFFGGGGSGAAGRILRFVL